MMLERHHMRQEIIKGVCGIIGDVLWLEIRVDGARDTMVTVLTGGIALTCPALPCRRIVQAPLCLIGRTEIVTTGGIMDQRLEEIHTIVFVTNFLKLSHNS
eukprot:m.13132 g.13132  ORF g.13132 m.13132 type:complete len:101 (-) comp4795_c0_seq1:24-326(-)